MHNQTTEGLWQSEHWPAAPSEIRLLGFPIQNFKTFYSWEKSWWHSVPSKFLLSPLGIGVGCRSSGPTSLLYVDVVLSRALGPWKTLLSLGAAYLCLKPVVLNANYAKKKSGKFCRWLIWGATNWVCWFRICMVMGSYIFLCCALKMVSLCTHC